MKKETIILYHWFCPSCGTKNKTRDGKGVCIVCSCNSKNYKFCKICGHVVGVKSDAKRDICDACFTSNA